MVNLRIEEHFIEESEATRYSHFEPGNTYIYRIWSIMEIDDIMFSKRGEGDLPGTFYLIKNIDPDHCYGLKVSVYV